MRDMRGRIAIALLCALFAVACGDERQDADAPSGRFDLDVTDASFPAEQRIAESSTLTLEVENTGDRAVPDLAVTVETEPGQDGQAPVAFGQSTDDPTLAAGARPVWIVDEGPSGGDSAYTNTWAVGPLGRGAVAHRRVEADGREGGQLHGSTGACRRRSRATSRSGTAARRARSTSRSPTSPCPRGWARTARSCAARRRGARPGRRSGGAPTSHSIRERDELALAHQPRLARRRPGRSSTAPVASNAAPSRSKSLSSATTSSHVAQRASAGSEHRGARGRARRVRDAVLGEVQRRVGAVAGAEQQHVAVEVVDPRQRRALAEPALQLVAGGDRLGLRADRRERVVRVRAAARARPRARELDHDAERARRRASRGRRRGISARITGHQSSGTGGSCHSDGSELPFVCVGTTSVPSGPSASSSALDDRLRAAAHPAERRERRVHEQHAAGPHAEPRAGRPRAAACVTGAGLAAIVRARRARRMVAAGNSGRGCPPGAR